MAGHAAALPKVLCVNRRQQKRKQARRTQHALKTRTPDRPGLLISGTDCPKVDNGHIVPRTYQRAWEGEGRQVAVHAPGNSACELKSTKTAGARGPFYRRTRPRHGTEIDDIEGIACPRREQSNPGAAPDRRRGATDRGAEGGARPALWNADDARPGLLRQARGIELQVLRRDLLVMNPRPLIAGTFSLDIGRQLVRLA